MVRLYIVPNNFEESTRTAEPWLFRDIPLNVKWAMTKGGKVQERVPLYLLEPKSTTSRIHFELGFRFAGPKDFWRCMGLNNICIFCFSLALGTHALAFLRSLVLLSCRYCAWRVGEAHAV